MSLRLVAALVSVLVAAPPPLLAQEGQPPVPPSDGRSLKTAGKITTITGLASLALVPAAMVLDRGSESHTIGPMFTIITAGVAFFGLVSGPLLYSVGASQARRFEKWNVDEPQLDSSAANRRFLVYGMLGETNFYFPGTNGGGTLLAFLSQNELLEARYFRGHRSDFSDDDIDRNQTGKFYGLLYTRFWANSFYTSSGIGYRSLDFRLKDEPEEGGSYVLERKDAGVLVSLGNRWQWKFLSIGAEWAGVFLPVNSIRERRATSPSVDGNSALDEEINEADGYRKIMFGLLAVHAGSSF